MISLATIPQTIWYDPSVYCSHAESSIQEMSRSKKAMSRFHADTMPFYIGKLSIDRFECQWVLGAALFQITKALYLYVFNMVCR